MEREKLQWSLVAYDIRFYNAANILSEAHAYLAADY
jgi:hypothetical protein